MSKKSDKFEQVIGAFLTLVIISLFFHKEIIRLINAVRGDSF